MVKKQIDDEFEDFFQDWLLWQHNYITGLRKKQDISGTTKTCCICTAATIQGRAGKITKTANSCANRSCKSHEWQEHFTGTQTKWKCLIMPRSSETKSSLDETRMQGPTVNNILPRLTHLKYLTYIGAKYCYLNLKSWWKIIILDNNSMQMWLVQICETTIWRYHSWWNVPEKDRQNIQRVTTVVLIAADILAVGYNDDTTRKVLQICRKENLKLSKQINHFQVWWNYI